MNIRVINGDHRIHIKNMDIYHLRDGSWFIYIRKNIRTHDKSFVSKMKNLVSSKNLIGCDIDSHYYDVLRVYTTCDKIEINKIKEMLIENFDFKSEDMYWVSLSESEDFKNENGWVTHVNRFFGKYATNVTKNQKNKKESRYRSFEQLEMEELRINVYQYFLEGALMNRKSMTIIPSFTSINYDIDPKFIFVLMPFSEDFSDFTYKIIKQAVESTGDLLSVKRADDFFMPGIIIEDIWECINKAGLIIADITKYNPNVFYELGIAHTLGKRVILIRGENADKSPFDIIAHRYLEYSSYRQEEFKDNLEMILKEYLKEINNFR